MSTTISCPQGFFQNDTVTPTTITDLESAVTSAMDNIDGAVAAEAAAAASAAAAAASDIDATNQASSALASANAAASSATGAASSATAAATSNTNATTQANNAATSATSAGNSATTATTQAGNASTSATAASGSATAAATSATNAATSATNAANSATSAAATVTTAIAGVDDIGRNKVDNALFNVAQRGGGPFTVANAYTLDRWLLSFSLDTPSITKAPFADSVRTQIGDEEAISGLGNAFTGNGGAGAFNLIQQRLENVRRLAGKTVIVSFYANASATLNLGVSLDQNFGTGGSPSSTVQGNGQSVVLGGTWTRYSLTFAVPTSIGKVFGTTVNTDFIALNFWYSSGSTFATRAGNVGVQSGTVNIWGVQLEIGSTLTQLEKRDPLVDISACQRQFWTGPVFVFGTVSGTLGTSTVTNPVTMRAAPTITGGTTGFTSNAGIASSTMNQNAASTVTLTFSAEL